MINAAGIIHVVPFLDVKPEEYKSLMAVNVDGTFFGTQLAARQMIAQAPNRKEGELIGRIINFTSPSAEANSWDQTVYSMSKGAVNRLTGGAAAALFRQHGICVTALKPYAIPSPMLQGIFESREERYGLPEGEPARQRARQLVHGRFEPLETHASVLLWMCAAPPESINGKYDPTQRPAHGEFLLKPSPPAPSPLRRERGGLGSAADREDLQGGLAEDLGAVGVAPVG